MKNFFQRAIPQYFAAVAVSALCAIAATAAQAGTISIGSVGVNTPAHTENFDAGALGTAAKQFAAYGLVFKTLSGIGASLVKNSDCSNEGHGVSGQYVYVGVTAPCNPNGSTDALSLTFTNVVSELSWTGFSRASSTGYTVSALLNNVVVSSVLFNNNNSFENKTVLIKGGNFNELRFVENGNSGNYFAIDNMAWNTANVPEPGSIALLGLGLALFAAHRRKA